MNIAVPKRVRGRPSEHAHYGVRKVEANALVVLPDAGRQLRLLAILKYLDSAGMAEHQRAIDTEREKVLQLWNERFGGWQNA